MDELDALIADPGVGRAKAPPPPIRTEEVKQSEPVDKRDCPDYQPKGKLSPGFDAEGKPVMKDEDGVYVNDPWRCPNQKGRESAPAPPLALSLIHI